MALWDASGHLPPQLQAASTMQARSCPCSRSSLPRFVGSALHTAFTNARFEPQHGQEPGRLAAASHFLIFATSSSKRF